MSRTLLPSKKVNIPWQSLGTEAAQPRTTQIASKSVTGVTRNVGRMTSSRKPKSKLRMQYSNAEMLRTTLPDAWDANTSPWQSLGGSMRATNTVCTTNRQHGHQYRHAAIYTTESMYCRQLAAAKPGILKLGKPIRK